MSVIGTAEVLVTPITAGFATKIEGQVAASNVAGKLEKQFANAGVLSGNAFTQKLTGAFKLAGFGNAGVGLGLALAAGVVVGLSKIGASFGAAKNQIIKETGATATEVAGLFDTVKRASRGVPASLGDIATAVDELFKRGVPLGRQLDLLAKQELFLAKVTKTDLGANVEATTALFAKFNVPLRDQSRELDVLFKAAQASGKSFTDLTGNLLSGAAALQQFGFNLDSSTALIAGLTRAGVNAGPALAGLRAGFGRIAKEGGDPVKVLQSLLAEFEKAPNSAKVASDAIKLFGGRAGAELVAALKAGRFNVSALLKTITDGKGGILATGAATLTLSDRFKLLRNRVEESLSGAGAAVRAAFSGFAKDISDPVASLTESLVGLGKSLGTILLPAALAVGVAFKGVVPSITDFAAGIAGVTQVIRGFDPAMLTAIGVVGGLTVALIALNAAGGLSGVFTGAAVLALENPVLAAIIGIGVAITALGAVIRAFKQPTDDTAKGVKSLQAAMFDTASTAGIFAGNVKTAGESFTAFVRAAQQSNKGLPVVRSLLRDAGTTAEQLGGALDQGGAAWISYAHAVEAGAVASGNFTKDRAAATIAVIKTRFDAAAKAGLRYAIAAKQISAAQVRAIIDGDTNSRGVVNYGRVLDAVNDKVALSASRADLAAQKQNDHAVAVASTTTSYERLALSIARSSISEGDAEKALEGFGLTAAGAKDQFKQLQDGIKNFVDTAHGQLPTVGTAVSDFGGQIKSDTDKLVSDFQTRAGLLAQFAKAGGKASKDLRDSIATNLSDIRGDFKRLVADQDPHKFTQNLINEAITIATFTANLRKLVAEGFAPLAAQLSQLGPEAAAQLAQSLASDPNQAALANAGSKLLGAVTSDADKFNRNLAATAVTGGELAGRAVGKGVADGITKELFKQFPELKAAGIVIGNTIGTAIAPALATHVPDLRRFGADAAAAAGGGITEGVNKALVTNPPAFGRYGRTGGHDYSAGLAAGITEGGRAATTAADQVAKDVLATQKGRFVSSSPSRAAFDIGKFYGQGLALGISSTGDLVSGAAATLADQTISATQGTAANMASTISDGLAKGITARNLTGLVPATAILAPFKGLPDAIASDFSRQVQGAFNTATSAAGLARWVSYAAGIADTFHTAFTAITVDVNQVQSTLDELTREGTKQSAKLGQTLIDRLVDLKLVIPRVAPAAPKSEDVVQAARQSIQVTAPQQREDARRQQDKARGVFDGATINFPHLIDPIQIANDIAWKLLQ